MLRRAWQWVFPSRPLTLELRTDVRSTVAALRQNVSAPGLRSIFKTGVIGRIDENGVRLRYQRLWSRNDYAPMFVGRFATIDGRRCLVGEFRAPRSTRAFVVFWIGFVLLWWILALAATAASTEPGIPLPLLLVTPPAMIGFVVALSRGGARFGKSGALQIEAVLREAVGAESTIAPR